MENAPIHLLMAAIVQEQDVNPTMRVLSPWNLPVFYLASTGGFLGRRNATLFIGMPEDLVESILAALRKSCRHRVEYFDFPLEGSLFSLSIPAPVMVGGANVFTFPVERYEEI